MSETHFYDQNFQSSSLEGAIGIEFEQCQFKDCDFTKAILKETKFIECEFVNCNFSNVDVLKTSFQDCHFIGCKMIGIGFHECNSFNLSLKFEACNLAHSSFAQMNLTNCSFKKCDLTGSDFGYADLSTILITECDLADTLFEQTNLKKADLRESVNYLIDPDNNQIKSAKFSKEHIAGLLIKYEIVID
jgi:fluoroquinolone resistance protein